MMQVEQFGLNEKAASVHFFKKNEHVLKFIRMKDLIELLGLSRSTIYDRLDIHSKYHDPDFPKSYKLNSSGTCRAVGWRLEEVYAYIQSIATNQAKEAA